MTDIITLMINSVSLHYLPVCQPACPVSVYWMTEDWQWLCWPDLHGPVLLHRLTVIALTRSVWSTVSAPAGSGHVDQLSDCCQYHRDQSHVCRCQPDCLASQSHLAYWPCSQTHTHTPLYKLHTLAVSGKRKALFNNALNTSPISNYIMLDLSL